MKLANRMHRLGTESAFEVLAKARALEVVTPGTKPIMFFTILAPCASPATRGSTPTPGSRCTPPSPPSPGPGQCRCRERDLVVLADEVYWAIRYGGGHASVLEVDGMAERTVLEGPWAPVERMVAAFRERRDVVVAGLNAINSIACQEPTGAFYAFPRVADLGLPAATLADRLLADTGVACLPGTAFGAYGEGYLRLSYANGVDNLRRTLTRIERVASHAPGG